MRFLSLLLLLSLSIPFAHASNHNNPFLSLKENQTLNLSYDIYSSGFKIAEQNITFSRHNTQLISSSITSSTGIANIIQDVVYTSELIATLLPHSLKITSYRILSEEGAFFTKKDASYIHYNTDSSNSYGYVPINNIDDDAHPRTFAKKYTTNSIPWPAIIPLIAVTPQKNINTCNMMWKTFDVGAAGHVKFSSPKETTIPESAYTKYIGKAKKCTLSYKPSPDIPSPSSAAYGKIRTKLVKGSVHVATILENFRVPVKFYLPQHHLNIIMHLVDYNLKDNDTHEPFNILPDIPLPS